MFSRIIHYAKVSKGLPLPLLFTRVMRKFGFQPKWAVRMDFLHSEDAKRPIKSLKIFLDAMKKAGISTQPIAQNIRDSVVLEVGCGRHVGFAPFVIGLGARRYIGIDPLVDSELLKSQKIIDNYFFPAFQAAHSLLSAETNFSKLGFDVLSQNSIEKLLSRCMFKKMGIDKFWENNTKVDICVSISCFEHILDFSAAAQALANISHEKTIHIHIVNFSNHLSKARPFHHLYEVPYETFGKLWGYNVNGLRVSDMLREFGGAGLKFRFVPLEKRPGALPKNIDNSWLKTHSYDELSIRTALLTSL